MPNPLLCIAASEAQASSIIERLHRAGFTGAEISILLPDNPRVGDPAGRGGRHGARSDLGAPEHFRDPLGWLAGMGSLSVAGVGPFIAAGPIVATLAGSAASTAIGGVKSALLGLGVPEPRAKTYQEQMEEGKILISVEPENFKQAAEAMAIFEQAGAQDISRVKEGRDRPVSRRPSSSHRWHGNAG